MMPDISYTYLADGDSVTSASLNDRFTEVESGINGIMDYAVRRGALNREHFDGSLVQESGWSDGGGVSALTVAGMGTHAYTTYYSAYGTNGSTDRKVVGSDEVGGGTYDSTNNQLVLTHSGVTLGMDQTDDIAGLLCLWNVEWEKFVQGAEATYTRLMTCLQIRSGSTWYTVRRTERIMQRRIAAGGPGSWTDTQCDQDCATRALITQSDLTDLGLAASATVTGVRVMCAVVSDSTGGKVELDSCRLTVLPLHAEIL